MLGVNVDMDECLLNRRAGLLKTSIPRYFVKKGALENYSGHMRFFRSGQNEKISLKHPR